MVMNLFIEVLIIFLLRNKHEIITKFRNLFKITNQASEPLHAAHLQFRSWQYVNYDGPCTPQQVQSNPHLHTQFLQDLSSYHCLHSSLDLPLYFQTTFLIVIACQCNLLGSIVFVEAHHCLSIFVLVFRPPQVHVLFRTLSQTPLCVIPPARDSERHTRV